MDQLGAQEPHRPDGRRVLGAPRFHREPVGDGESVAVAAECGTGVGIVAGLVRHVPERVHSGGTEPGDEIERDEAAGDLHHREHDRHIGVISQADGGENSQAGHECPGRVRTVISGDGRPVNPPEIGEERQGHIREDPDQEIEDQPQPHKSERTPQDARIQGREFFAASPSDGDEEVHRQALIDRIRELELDPEDRDQKPHVKEEE